MESILASAIANYQQIAVFVGSFFFGESVIITLSVLGKSIGLTFGRIFIMALLGTVLADLTWFKFGDVLLKDIKLIDRWNERVSKEYSPLVKRITRHGPVLSLLYIKFLYGTRVLTILYLSSVKVSIRKFLIFDTIGTIAWLSVIVGFSWSLGASAKSVIREIQDVAYLILIAIAILIAFRIFSKWMQTRLRQK